MSAESERQRVVHRTLGPGTVSPPKNPLLPLPASFTVRFDSGTVASVSRRDCEPSEREGA